jgi:hypothetical protein
LTGAFFHKCPSCFAVAGHRNLDLRYLGAIGVFAGLPGGVVKGFNQLGHSAGPECRHVMTAKNETFHILPSHRQAKGSVTAGVLENGSLGVEVQPKLAAGIEVEIIQQGGVISEADRFAVEQPTQALGGFP